MVKIYKKTENIDRPGNVHIIVLKKLLEVFHMTLFKRYGFFIITNLLVMVTISIAFNVISAVFGLPPYIEGNYVSLLIMAAMFGFGGSLFQLFASKWMAKTMYGVKILDPNQTSPQFRFIIDSVHEYARKAGLKKMPEVGIYESPEVNAFATGPSRNNSLVAVSTGLLQRMDKDEIEGVLGHEVAHIANGDMVTMVMIQGVVNTFVIFISRIIARAVASSVDERYEFMVYFGVSIAADILFSFLGSIVTAFFSRSREFRADKGGALLAGKDKMVRALRALDSGPVLEVDNDQKALASLKISGQQGGLALLMSTHPPIKKRIAALDSM